MTSMKNNKGIILAGGADKTSSINKSYIKATFANL